MPKVIKFLQTDLEETATLGYIIKLLTIYPQLDSFMRLSKVTDHVAYQIQIQKFKQNLIHFQEAASKTIYTNKVIGDSEFFYGQILFCYYPILVNHIWKDHKLGIGIFTL